MSGSKNPVKTVKVHGMVIPKTRIREDAQGNKTVVISSRIPLACYQFMLNYADPDMGKSWESFLVRKIIRQWVDEETKRMSAVSKPGRKG